MPALDPSNASKYKILVTGASGYIAAWVVKKLLEAGYSVRGTVRSAEKGEVLKKIFAEYGDRFEYAIVPDIAKEGAFDSAVQGVDAIDHTASPFILKAGDPDALIKPAVQGTVGILQSALKFGSSVKRIVVLSSCAAVLTILPEPKGFSEADWNEQSIEIVNRLGKEAPALHAYYASKTLAEKAAWEFYRNNKDKINWDLVVLNPPFVFGPVIHDIKNPASLGTSAGDWYKIISLEDHGGIPEETLINDSAGWVDVRDLSEAHRLAFEKEAAGGERIIISEGPYIWQDFLDAANALNPSPIPSHKLGKGVLGAERKYFYNYDTSKSTRILGISYRTIEETTRDTLADFEARGW